MAFFIKIKVLLLSGSCGKVETLKGSLHMPIAYLKLLVWICMDVFYGIYQAIVSIDSLQPGENVYVSY